MSLSEPRQPRSGWTFLTNHARILLLISRTPEARLRDLAAACGLTERAVQAIVTDLETSGYLIRERAGRRNHYRIVPGTLFRHPAEAHLGIDGLLRLVDDHPRPSAAEAHRAAPITAPADDPAGVA
ncbi:MarR family transcriptional regulator [Kitasatospora sp. NPDC085879]|uniref:helix-turn-helix transcriptional regulator n=1 Tax=Kitasatospora sp. NPDC085879 TaxID=3154769 RepID=UPI000BB0FCE6|nr:MarR family transcriptional regulator [Streptomyces sp. TLI_235]PBC69993.1 MarR family protein [Streptomyces sp. TLI_235]